MEFKGLGQLMQHRTWVSWATEMSHTDPPTPKFRKAVLFLNFIKQKCPGHLGWSPILPHTSKPLLQVSGMMLVRGICLCIAVCLVAKSCPTLCDPVDCSSPGFSVHGILQGRKLGRVAMPSSRGSSWPRDRTPISCISWIGRRIVKHWATWELASD